MIDTNGLTRRGVLAGTAAAAGVLAAPGLLRAQTRTLSWVTHPAILTATGDGEVFRAFEEANGVKVEVVTFPTEALGARIQQELVTTSAAFDVFSMADAFWTTRVARFCEPLDPLNAASPLPSGGLDDFSQGMLQQFRVPQTADGPLMGIPQRMSISLLYYRRDLLDAAGIAVPTTLAAFYEAAKALTTPAMSGAVYQGQQGQAGTLDWYEYAASLGADLLAPPDWNRAAFNSAAGIEALVIRRRMLDEGIVNPGAVSYGFDDAINAIAQGNAAMGVLYSAYWSRFKDPAVSQVVDTIGFAPHLRNPDVDRAHPARGWAMCINGASSRKDLAWEFIRYMTDVPQQTWMAVNKGNPASRLSVFGDPAFKAAVPVADALAEGLKHSKIMPNTAELPKVYDTVSLHLTSALSGGIAPEAALAAAETDVNALLG